MLLSWFLPALVLLSPNDRFVENARFRVRVEAPPGWTIRQQNAYPSMVATLRHPGGGQMTLSAQALAPNETVLKFAQRNRQALEKMGMRARAPAPMPSDALLVEAVTQDDRTRVRQLYATHGPYGYVLTLTAPSARADAYTKDFDFTWRNLTYLDEE